VNYWLLLADPKSYGFDDLQRDKSTVWDGISGSLAQKHLRNFKRGDRVLIYHTAPGKAVVGSAAVSTDPYLDPSDDSGKRVVVKLADPAALPHPVPLAALRGNPALSGMVFLKIQRIAVSPISRPEFDEIVAMSHPD
jgi:predicted RNA-binding protein with PUA-like domain